MNRLEKLLPRYSMIPLVMVVVFNFLVYMGTRPFTSGLTHYEWYIGIDRMIPFVPFFILFYLLAYAQWVIGYVVLSRESRYTCYSFCLADAIAKFICMIFFILYPTTIARPEVQGSGIWEILTRFIYSMDPPDNLFPSIHCLESWLVARAAFELKKPPRWYPVVMLIFSILVFASTVCLKQHVFLDILGGIAVGEIGLWIARRVIRKEALS